MLPLLVLYFLVLGVIITRVADSMHQHSIFYHARWRCEGVEWIDVGKYPAIKDFGDLTFESFCRQRVSPPQLLSSSYCEGLNTDFKECELRRDVQLTEHLSDSEFVL